MRMRRTSRTTNLATLALSLRWLASRYALGLLFVVAALCVTISQTKPEAISAVRARLTQGLIPLWQTLATPGNLVSSASNKLQDWRHTYDENIALRAENAALRQWQQEAQRLTAENARLAQLQNFVPPTGINYVTAKVVTDIGGSYQRSLLVLAGAVDSIATGAIAMGPNGVIGRVVEVGPKAARVLLLTDVNARIPVRLEQTGATAIVAGDGSAAPHLIYVPRDVTPVIGERVVTSGHGGIFPSGLPVGTVASIDGDDITVAPTDTAEALDIVRLVTFNPPTDTAPATPKAAR